MLGVCMVGFGQGSLFPIITLRALDRVHSHQADRAVALTSSFTFLGQFISPLILDGVGKIANSTAIRFQYGALAVSVFIVVLISTVYLFPVKGSVGSIGLVSKASTISAVWDRSRRILVPKKIRILFH